MMVNGEFTDLSDDELLGQLYKDRASWEAESENIMTHINSTNNAQGYTHIVRELGTKNSYYTTLKGFTLLQEAGQLYKAGQTAPLYHTPTNMLEYLTEAGEAEPIISNVPTPEEEREIDRLADTIVKEVQNYILGEN